MLVLVLGLVQVNFHLQVRKADLALISMKQVDTLMKHMENVMNLTIVNDYSVRVQMTLDGVTILTKE